MRCLQGGPAADRAADGIAARAGKQVDWLALIPGIRPAIDVVTSVGAVANGLANSAAVFLVVYIAVEELRAHAKQRQM